MKQSPSQAALPELLGWRPQRLPQHAAQTAETLILAGGILIMPLLPFLAAMIARDARYALRYPRTLARTFAHIRAMRRSHAIARFILGRRAGDAGAKPVGACTHCGNCCLHRSCVFLDFDRDGLSVCRIYGGRVWKALACAQYPQHQFDIDLYDCPSFRTPFASARTITIHPVRAAPPVARLPSRRGDDAAAQ